MKRNYKALTILLALVLMIATLTACGGTSEPEPTPEPTATPVATPEPEPPPLAAAIVTEPPPEMEIAVPDSTPTLRIDELRSLFRQTFGEIFGDASPEMIWSGQGSEYYEHPEDGEAFLLFPVFASRSSFLFAIEAPINRFFDSAESFTVSELREMFGETFRVQPPGGDWGYVGIASSDGFQFFFWMTGPDDTNITHVRILLG